MNPVKRMFMPLAYALACKINHHPRLLRDVAALVRRFQSHSATLLASRELVWQALRSPQRLSHTAHAGHLPAGPFLIGLPAGPAHACQRAQLQQALGSAADWGRWAGEAALESLRVLGTGGRTPDFDLVPEYLQELVWAALSRPLGPAAQPIRDHGPGLFEELRLVGAHLVVGGAATAAVQRRAEAAGLALRQRVQAAMPLLRAHWPAGDDELRLRQAVGLLWVGHPATVQAGALLMQELLARPAVYAELRRVVAERGCAAWQDGRVRALLRDHVLELLRFRPPFPFMPRELPRPAELSLPDGSTLKLGRSALLMLIGALFDPAALREPGRYEPGRRRWHNDGEDEDDRLLLFAQGPRECIAAEQVLEILVSALLGLLTLPRLHWGSPRWNRIGYAGPSISRFRLRQR